MALPPTGATAGEHLSAQESMFEDEPGYPELEAYEAASDDPSFETASETASEFSEDAPEQNFETAEEQPSTSAPNPVVAVEPEPMTVLTVDDFAALEERILRAVSLVRREREARIAAEERAAVLETEVQAQIPAFERLQQEVDSLRAEREQVRQRVERLLGQLDAMEL